jgi:hypothetical protein
VLKFANECPEIVIQDWMDLDDVIGEAFERTYDSQLGDDLFGEVDGTSYHELVEREYDE